MVKASIIINLLILTNSIMEKKLYRARSGKVLAGVAAGLAEYFAIDPLLVRIIFVVLALANGLGILGYLIFLVLTPEEPADAINSRTNMENDHGGGPQNQPADSDNRGRKILPGVILIVLGLIFLISNFVPEFDMGKLWPVILVVVGAALLWPRKR